MVRKLMLTCIFIPSILLFALFFLIHLELYSLNAESSLKKYWIAFQNVWYKSIPFYAMMTFIVFYIILMVQLSKNTN